MVAKVFTVPFMLFCVFRVEVPLGGRERDKALNANFG